MGIKHYYNTIVNGSGSAAAEKAYKKYAAEIADKVSASSRFIYAGNLDSPGVREIVSRFLEDCTCSDVVLGLEGAISSVSAKWIEALPEGVEVVVVPVGKGVGVAESAMLYAYSQHGITSPALKKYYRKQAGKLFNILPCDTVEFLTSEKIDTVEAMLYGNKKTVWHKLPMCFYDRLSGMLYQHPAVVKSWKKRFDEVIQHNSDYGVDIWKNERCHGIYAKLKGLDFAEGDNSTTMCGKLTVRSEDSGIAVNEEVVLGSRIYDGVFRYPAEMHLTETAANRGTRTSTYDLSADFPNQEMKGWYSTNVLYASFDMFGNEVLVPMLVDKQRNPFRKKIYEIAGTDYVCEIKDIYRHYRLVIRNRLVTDAPIEKAKLTAAFIAHLATPWHRPVVLYEKKCHSYEESASALFEKLVDRGKDKVRYILAKDAKKDLAVDKRYKRRIVEQFSFRHYYNLFAGKCILSSEAIGHALEKGTNSRLFKNMIVDGHKDYVFLQHGVMYMVSLASEQRNFFNKRSGHGKQKVVVSSALEAKHFTDNTDYKPSDMYISGLPKYDKSYLYPDADKIAVMLTWRPWEEVTGMTDIRQTGYYGMLRDIVRSIPEELRDKLIVMPHPLTLDQVQANGDDEVWKYYQPGLKYEEMLRQSKVLITDYSSISYDAFYRGANVIFCWAEKDYCMSQYGENAHLMLTEDLAFGEVCYRNEDVRDAVVRAYENGQSEKFIENYRQIVTYHDGRNTERLIEMLDRDGIIGEGGQHGIVATVMQNRYVRKVRNYVARKQRAAAKSAYPAMLGEAIDEKAVILEARNGKEIDGNIFYILKELLTNEAYAGFRIYLSVADKSVEKLINEKLAGSLKMSGADEAVISRVTPVTVDSREYYHAFATSKYIINDATIKNFFVKRDEQIYLNVWHGTPFKYMGRKVAHEPQAIGNAQKNFAVADYLLYPNEYMMNHMIEDYMIEDISKARILLSGYPRNSAMLDKESREKIRLKEELTDKRVYVYMPTWRPESMGFTTEGILAEFDSLLGDDEVMYAKIHPLAADNIDFAKLNRVKKYPSGYETYEFLNTADCLITDYSSVFYDYAVTGRKIVLFTYDEEEYFRTRGVYESIETLPFTRTATAEDALNAARTPKDYDDSEFLARFCSLESADATEKLLNRVFTGADCGIDEREMPSNGRDIVMIEGGNLDDEGRATEVLKYLGELNPEEKNYYLTYHRNKLKEDYEMLFSLPEGIRYYGRAGKSDYPAALEHRRNYGNIKITEEIETI